MADAAARERLSAIARRVRRFLEPQWWCWRGAEGRSARGHLSQGTCDRSSLFLLRVLEEEGLDARFVIGAPSKGPHGYFAAGTWRGHAWVECEGFILDLTADQFGAPAVQVIPADDPRYSGSEDVSDAEVVLRRTEMARQLLVRWRAGGASPAAEPEQMPWQPDDFQRLCEEQGE